MLLFLYLNVIKVMIATLTSHYNIICSGATVKAALAHTQLNCQATLWWANGIICCRQTTHAKGPLPA